MKIVGNGGHAKVIRELYALVATFPDSCAFIAIGNNADRKAEAERHNGMALYDRR